MHGSLGVLSTQYGGFLALIVIGGLAGWIAGKIIGIRHGVLATSSSASQARGSVPSLPISPTSQCMARSNILSPPWSARRRFSISGN